MALKSLLALFGCTLLMLSLTSADFSKLVFHDEFNELDVKTWKHELTLGGGGNWEFQYYSNNRTNSYVKNGVLYIKPTLLSDAIGQANVETGPYTLDIWGLFPASICTGNGFFGCSRASGNGNNVINPIQSARIRTADSFNFKYGKVEIRAKLPRGDWLWPALWMMPRDNAYGEWPASGEIDIIESRGNSNYPPGGVNQIGSTLHWGPHWPLDPYEKTRVTYTLPSGDFADAFHVFGLVWNSTNLFTYVDDPSRIVLNVQMNDQSFWQRGGWTNSAYNNPWAGRGNNAPFDQEFYLILCLAVGGQTGYWPDGYGKPWTNSDPQAINNFWAARNDWLSTWVGDDAALQVDYVRVWQSPDNCATC